MKVLVVLSAMVVATCANAIGRNGGFETVYDSQRDGVNHPYVVYDSKRDGASGKQFGYQNDASVQTVFDSKRDGWNHPYVVSDSRRDNSRSFNGFQQQQTQRQPMIYNQQQQPTYNHQTRMVPQQGRQRMMNRNIGGSGDYSNYEVIYDSKRDGLNHPFVIYDSKRDGQNSPLRSMYANDPNLETIFDTKVHGWNHPWVLYDSTRDGARNNY